MMEWGDQRKLELEGDLVADYTDVEAAFEVIDGVGNKVEIIDALMSLPTLEQTNSTSWKGRVRISIERLEGAGE